MKRKISPHSALEFKVLRNDDKEEKYSRAACCRRGHRYSIIILIIVRKTDFNSKEQDSNIFQNHASALFKTQGAPEDAEKLFHPTETRTIHNPWDLYVGRQSKNHWADILTKRNPKRINIHGSVLASGIKSHPENSMKTVSDDPKTISLQERL